MAPIYLDRTIKASHSLREISKVRFLYKSSASSWQLGSTWGGGGGGYLADVLHVCQRRSGKKGKKINTLSQSRLISK